MSVYVDPLFNCPGPRGYNRWCHMIADTLEELHAMAAAIGMKREWFQHREGKTPHYDLVPSKRALAVKLGAIEISGHELARKGMAMRAGLPAKPIPVISLTQPWATLMILGFKRVETRGWRPKHRGALGIHASAGYPREAREFAAWEPIKELLGDAELPLGAILGVTNLVDVLPTEDAIHRISEQEELLGNYARGRQAWFTEGMTPLAEPLPAKGALGLWDWPATVLAPVQPVERKEQPLGGLFGDLIMDAS